MMRLTEPVEIVSGDTKLVAYANGHAYFWPNKDVLDYKAVLDTSVLSPEQKSFYDKLMLFAPQIRETWESFVKESL